MNITTYSLLKAGPGSVLCNFVKEFVKPRRLSKSFTASQLCNSSPPVMRLIRSDGIPFSKKTQILMVGRITLHRYESATYDLRVWKARSVSIAHVLCVNAIKHIYQLSNAMLG